MQPTHFAARSAFAALAFTILALPFSNIAAHEGHDHGPTEAKTETSSEPWKMAQASVKAMETAAAAKEHEPIHNEQEKLVVALKKIQEQGQGASDKARLDGAIKNAITASEKVHTAADAKDFAKVESGLKTLQASMALVEKQLPAGSK